MFQFRRASVECSAHVSSHRARHRPHRRHRPVLRPQARRPRPRPGPRRPRRAALCRPSPPTSTPGVRRRGRGAPADLSDRADLARGRGAGRGRGTAGGPAGQQRRLRAEEAVPGQRRRGRAGDARRAGHRGAAADPRRAHPDAGPRPRRDRQRLQRRGLPAARHLLGGEGLRHLAVGVGRPDLPRPGRAGDGAAAGLHQDRVPRADGRQPRVRAGVDVARGRRAGRRGAAGPGRRAARSRCRAAATRCWPGSRSTPRRRCRPASRGSAASSALSPRRR